MNPDLIKIIEEIALFSYRTAIIVMLFLILGHVEKSKASDILVSPEESTYVVQAVQYAHEMLGVKPTWTNYASNDKWFYMSVDRRAISDKDAERLVKDIKEQLSPLGYCVEYNKVIVNISKGECPDNEPD